MAWIAITESNLLSEFTPAEKNALVAVQAAIDNIPAILTAAIAQARAVISNSGASLGAAGTVPESLFPFILALARWRFLTAFPQFKALQTDDRRKAAEECQKQLDEITSLDRSVEPGTPGTFNPAGNSGTQTRIPMRTGT